MKNKFVAIIASLFLFTSMTSLKAEAKFGISFIAAQSDISGSEQENGSTDDKNTKSLILLRVDEGYIFIYHKSIFSVFDAANNFSPLPSRRHLVADPLWRFNNK